MGIWKRIGRSGKAAVLLAAGLAGGAAAVAVATVPGSDGVIHACYSIDTNGNPVTTGGPNLTIIDPAAGQSCPTSRAGAPETSRSLDWNQAGPAGPTGPQGAPGQTGANGQAGPQGPAVTVANGNKLTLPGGQVITVTGGNGVTIVNPPVNPGRTVGLVTLGGAGGLPPAFDIAGLNFQTGAHGAGGGGGAGKVAVHDISITKHVDQSSTKLFQFCANGKHIPKVTITMRKAGKTYLTYTLTDVVISSYSTGGGGAGKPTESLSLNFTKIEYKYTPQKS